mgnify:CR=1 FL=1
MEAAKVSTVWMRSTRFMPTLATTQSKILNPISQWRGGSGAIRAFTFLDDAGFALEGEGHAFQPWGFDGGQDGFEAELTLVHGDGTTSSLPSKVPYFKVKAGEKLVSTGPSGGAYGDPSLRNSDDVDADVADVLLSRQAAKKLFG